MRGCRILGSVALGVFLLAQCTGADPGSVTKGTAAMSEECVAALAEPVVTPVEDDGAATLAPVSTCAEVVPAIARQAIQEMNTTLDRNLREALTVHCQPCVGWPSSRWDGGGGYGNDYDYGSGGSHFGCGGGSSSPSNMSDGGVSDGAHIQFDGSGYWSGADAAASQGDSGAGGDSADEYSTTNNQVAGVDEPDFLKNDGSYIYIVANGRFHIIDAWPPETAQKLAAVPVDGTPTGLFVYSDRAVVYSVLGTYQPPCTYAYGCQVTGTGGPFVMTVFDITDRANPVKLRRIESNGSLVSSRRMGNIVHTISVVGHSGYGIRSLWSEWPSDLSRATPYCSDSSLGPRTLAQVRAAFEQLRARNTAAIERWAREYKPSTMPLPQVVDERTVNGKTVHQSSQLADCNGFYVTASTDGLQVLTLTSFDLTAQDPVGVTSVFGSAGAVYANAAALYVAQPVMPTSYYYWAWGRGWGYDWASHERTAVHKFRVAEDRAATEYAGSGLVQGHVLNQFALDEYDGYLRVASGVGWIPDPGAHSAVTVLAEASGRLEVVGLLDSIAPGEDIRSSRFVGDTAYLVTFRRTDPLYVVDLSDPFHPIIRGYLVIPGFSTYMHPMDDTHVIGIGFTSESGGWFRGLQLQIFDVGNPSTPLLKHKETIDTWGSTSDAATNHLAFNYFAPKELLAVPLVVCTQGNNGYYGARMTFDGLVVYHATVADGFQLRGGIPHADPAVADADGNGCYTWWTSPDSGVKRSIIMDDYVYAVALDVIKVSALADLMHPLASVDLLH